MGISNRAACSLATRPLLLEAGPGPALAEAVRLYDPGFRRWGGRLARRRVVFRNGVLLFDPIPARREGGTCDQAPAAAAR